MAQSQVWLFPSIFGMGEALWFHKRMEKAKGRVIFWADLLWALLGETSTVKTKSILLTSALTPRAALWASQGHSITPSAPDGLATGITSGNSLSLPDQKGALVKITCPKSDLQ